MGLGPRLLVVAFALTAAGALAAASLSSAGIARGGAPGIDQAAPTQTPLPPCVDQQYAPGTAGSGCQVRGDTTPTALCTDGTFDYSRLLTACAGHGGVYEWLSATPSTVQPNVGAPTTSASPTATASPTSSATATGAIGVGFGPISGASRGSSATVTAQAPPGSSCTLLFIPPGGSATSAIQIPPSPQTAGASGQITWTWTIPSDSPTGNATLNLSCGSVGSASGVMVIS